MAVEMHRECGQEAELTVLSEAAKEAIVVLLDQIKGAVSESPLAPVKEAGRFVAMEMDSLHEATVQCPFSGMVDVSVRGPAPVLLSWICPTCGHEHEEGPD